MGSKLFGGLLYSIKMYICQGHANYEHPQSSQHQVCGLCTSLNSSYSQVINLHGYPNNIWVLGVHPREWAIPSLV